MLYKTKGIVLKTVKYGETSLVATVFTELFGIQTYMVHGVRGVKQSAQKAAYFQPASLLDMVVYHREQKTMHHVKEFKWSFRYQTIFSDVLKNSVALYMLELLYKCLKYPEKNTDLFYFFEDVLLQLDIAEKTVTANIPLYFTLQLPYFLGFKIEDSYSETHTVLDLREGRFVQHLPATHPYFLEGENALWIAQLLKAIHPNELSQFKLNREVRKKLLLHLHDYYALHLHDFGQMKTIAILHEILAEP